MEEKHIIEYRTGNGMLYGVDTACIYSLKIVHKRGMDLDVKVERFRTEPFGEVKKTF